MTREHTKSDGTGFNWAVSAQENMAKETVGARVPIAVANQVYDYTQTHGITRTATIDLFIRTGLGDPSGGRKKRAYTVQIRHSDDLGRREWGGKMVDWPEWWLRQLRAADRIEGDWSDNEALTARLPGEVVRGIEQWAESQDMPVSVAAEDLLIRGMKADPLPDENPDPIPEHVDYSDAVTETVELGPQDAELFRRCRLHYGKGPSETVAWLMSAADSSKNARIGYAKPDKE